MLSQLHAFPCCLSLRASASPRDHFPCRLLIAFVGSDPGFTRRRGDAGVEVCARSRARETLGQDPHLLGHHGKAGAVLAGLGGLDRRVEGQQVRLVGDAGDRRDDLADLGGLAGQRRDL